MNRKARAKKPARANNAMYGNSPTGIVGVKGDAAACNALHVSTLTVPHNAADALWTVIPKGSEGCHTYLDG